MLNKNLKKGLREKIVQYYIDLIKGEELSNENFWNEFFLLKANVLALKQELEKIENNSDLINIIQILFQKSIVAINDSNQLRIVNGLVTLFTISYHVILINNDENSKEKILTILDKNDDESKRIRDEFVETTCLLLFNDEIHYGIKSIILKLLAILATSSNTINSNEFIENFILNHQLFDALINLFSVSIQNDQQQQNELWILLLLTIFLNYKKENTNPYVMKLSIVDNDIVLNRYSRTIANHLMQFILKYDQFTNENKSGLFSSISNMVGTIFSNDDNCGNTGIGKGIMNKKFPFHIVNLVLLALYEAISLNRNFISLLTTTLVDSSVSDKDNDESEDAMNFSEIAHTNLLVTFLEFCSIIMLGMKDGANTPTARLCFIILTCITEDASANSIIHDNNMSFIVNLRRMPMRHKKLSIEKNKNVLRPICHTILDLMIEFISAHLNRHINLETFCFSLGIIQRILSFQKRCKVRINYDWKELWSSLILLIKFLLKNESEFFKQQQHQPKQIDNMFSIMQRTVTIFNIFILYGDNFLHSDHCYDELYYEIIRMHTVFDNLNSFGLRYMTKDDTNLKYKEESQKLTSCLINIKAIIAHLNTKIELYSQQNKIISEQQVFDVVRNNYDTLTLKLADNLDSYEPYNFAESNELKFFANIMMTIIDELTIIKPFHQIDSEEHHNLILEIQLLNSTAINSTEIINNQSSDNNNDESMILNTLSTLSVD